MAGENDFFKKASEMFLGLFGTESGEREAKLSKDKSIGFFAEFLKSQDEGRGIFAAYYRTEGDKAAAVGSTVELTVKIDSFLSTGVKEIIFKKNGVEIGTAQTDIQKTASIFYIPKEPGLFEIDYEFYNLEGLRLEPETPPAPTILQVIDREPVIAIDAALIRKKDQDLFQALRAINKRGFSIIYFELKNEKTDEDVIEIVRAENLPRAAVLSDSESEENFATYGYDFRQVITSSNLRKLMVEGLPIVALAGETKDGWRLLEDDGIAILDEAGLVSFSEDDSEIKKTEAKAREFVEQIKKYGCRFTRALDIMTGSRLKRAQDFHFQFDNKAAREEVFEAIGKAQKLVMLQFYIFQDGLFAEDLGVRLVERARAGVDVYLMVDALYSTQNFFGLKNRIVEGLSKEENIHVVALDAVSFEEDIEIMHFKQRDHRKMIVVDDRIAFVSGRNAGDKYYYGFEEIPVGEWTTDERIPWLDAHLRLEGELAGVIANSFREVWRRNGGGEITGGEESAPVECVDQPGRFARLVVHEGVSDANALGAYDAIIESANERITIVNDFPVISIIASSLRRAVLRGVDVRFITGTAVARKSDGEFFKGSMAREMFEYMTKKRFELLMKYGVKVYEYMTAPGMKNIVSRGGVIRPYVHAKVIAADGKVASIGSANLDATASFWEREAIVIVEDKEFVMGLEKALDEIISHSDQLKLGSDYWRRETTKRDIVSRIWPDSLYS